MRRRGFTLVEVMVALFVASIVAVLAHRVVVAVTDGARAIADRRAALDRVRNAERYLDAAFLSLDVGGPGGGSFEGKAEGVRFSAWLETPEGWFRRERLELLVRDGRLVAAGSGGDLVLARGVADVHFDYLLDYGAAERWATEWVSPLSAPLAVRMRVRRSGVGQPVVDTTLYLIKGRG